MATFSWTKSVAGDWNVAANWQDNVVPNGIDADVVIDPPAAAGVTAKYNVTIAAGASETVRTLDLGSTLTSLTINGKLTFAPGSSGAIGVPYGSALITLNGGTLVNAGDTFALIQTNGNVLLTGANPFYLEWEMQALSGTATIDTDSIGEYNAATNTLFDGIYEAIGANQAIDLGGKTGGLKVDVETLTGPKATPTSNFWTDLIYDNAGSQLNEWNGTAYVPIELTLKLIRDSAYVTVSNGRGYTTANALTIGNDGVFEQSGGTLSTGGLTLLAGGLLMGGFSTTGSQTSEGQVIVNGAVVNNGQIVSEGPGMVFRNAITGTGAIVFNRTTVLPGFDRAPPAAVAGTLEVGSVAAGQTVTMIGNDTLVLDTPAAFAGVIAGFAATDKIVLTSASAVTSATYTAGANGVGTLTLSTGAATFGTLTLAGDFTGQVFSVAAGAAANTYNLSVGSAPPPVNRFQLTDTTTGVSSNAAGDAYVGPVAGLQNQYIYLGADNVNITAVTPNSFIRGGPGTDAIDVSKAGGANVLDGSTGSNFLVGGQGSDTFFVDDRIAASDIWSTVVNFHAGDAATIFGVTSTGFALDYEDGQGAAGATGLTLHAIASGKPIASLTLAGYSKADMDSGRLGISFGTEPNGDAYMFIKGN